MVEAALENQNNIVTKNIHIHFMTRSIFLRKKILREKFPLTQVLFSIKLDCDWNKRQTLHSLVYLNNGSKEKSSLHMK